MAVAAAPEFDATYAWRMGGRVRIELDDGSVYERTVHGQRGSMHDPFASADVDAKFSAVTAGMIPVGGPARIRRAVDGSARQVRVALAG